GQSIAECDLISISFQPLQNAYLDHLGDTRIGKPFAGRRVIFCTGHTLASGKSRISNRWNRVASKIVASCKANEEPMQVRGPVPKGKYAKRGILPFEGGRKRAGSKTSGRSQSFRCRWST